MCLNSVPFFKAIMPAFNVIVCAWAIMVEVVPHPKREMSM